MNAIEIKTGMAYEGPGRVGQRSRIWVIGRLPLGLVAVVNELSEITAENPEKLAAWADTVLSSKPSVLLLGQIEPCDSMALVDTGLQCVEILEKPRSAAAVGDLGDLVRTREVEGARQSGDAVALEKDDSPRVILFSGETHRDASARSLGSAEIAESFSALPGSTIDAAVAFITDPAALSSSGRGCSLTAHDQILGE